MPIIVPKGLPAIDELKKEQVFLMDDIRATTQDIRPLEIALVNLMPKKMDTEKQFLRLLSNNPLQMNIDFITTETHVAKNTPKAHIDKFYKSIYDVRNKKYDGMIITGAPVEDLSYEEVDYWNEMKDIFDFTQTNSFSTMFICWGALSALYYFYDIPKYPVDRKIFGVFEHTVLEKMKVVRGFDDVFYVPHSRHMTLRDEDVEKIKDVKIISKNSETGPSILYSDNDFYILGHFEYEYDTLDSEYRRDLGKRSDVSIPKNYYPDDDPNNSPKITWRAHANLLFSNWLNYYVYQEVPFVNI